MKERALNIRLKRLGDRHPESTVCLTSIGSNLSIDRHRTAKSKRTRAAELRKAARSDAAMNSPAPVQLSVAPASPVVASSTEPIQKAVSPASPFAHAVTLETAISDGLPPAPFESDVTNPLYDIVTSMSVDGTTSKPKRVFHSSKTRSVKRNIEEWTKRMNAEVQAPIWNRAGPRPAAISPRRSSNSGIGSFRSPTRAISPGPDFLSARERRGTPEHRPPELEPSESWSVGMQKMDPMKRQGSGDLGIVKDKVASSLRVSGTASIVRARSRNTP